MTLTEDPQQLLKLQQFYLAQVTQFYQQIQAWGKDKLKFTPPEDYPIYDKTGEYQAQILSAKSSQKNADGLEGNVDFFPHGITFLTEEGVTEPHGPPQQRGTHPHAARETVAHGKKWPNCAAG